MTKPSVPEVEDAELVEDEAPESEELDPVEEAFALALQPAPSALARADTAAAPPPDPATVYLSRFAGRSQRTMLSTLRTVGGLLLSKPAGEVDPRDVPWAKLRYHHVSQLKGLMQQRYATATVNRHLVALRGVVQECRRLGLMGAEDAANVADVQAVRGNARETGRALKPEEVSALFAACDQSAGGRRDAGVLALTAGGGLRRAEVCALDMEHWSAVENRLEVHGKGNKWRNVYLPPDGVEALKSWLAVRGDAPGPLLWPMSKHGTPVTGKRLSEHGVYDLLAAIGARARVLGFTPHDLRRTFITRLLDQGTDALTVSKLVGHSSVQTTMRYDRRGEGAKQQAVAILKLT